MGPAECDSPPPAPQKARQRRMLLLLAGIVVLSGADLAVALQYLRGPGLLEANPIAALVIAASGSAAVLAAYKAVTVGTCVSLLFVLRRRVEAEVAAWIAVGALGLMSLHWLGYGLEQAQLQRLQAVAGTDAPGEWLRVE